MKHSKQHVKLRKSERRFDVDCKRSKDLFLILYYDLQGLHFYTPGEVGTFFECQLLDFVWLTPSRNKPLEEQNNKTLALHIILRLCLTW